MCKNVLSSSGVCLRAQKWSVEQGGKLGFGGDTASWEPPPRVPDLALLTTQMWRNLGRSRMSNNRQSCPWPISTKNRKYYKDSIHSMTPYACLRTCMWVSIHTHDMCIHTKEAWQELNGAHQMLTLVMDLWVMDHGRYDVFFFFLLVCLYVISKISMLQLY